MINIDAVYQKVLSLANKEQRGYITPQDFNNYSDQAQKEIFEQYFYDLNQFIRVRSNAEEYSDIIHNLNEKIAFFESTGVSLTLPSNLYRLGTVINNGNEVEEVQQNELLYMKKSALTIPTNDRRVYVRLSANTIAVTPPTNDISYTYVKKPSRPSWGYFVVGGKALHDPDPNKTTNFELHPSEEHELVYKILKYAGITMRKDDVIRVGQVLESSQVQQEKQ